MTGSGSNGADPGSNGAPERSLTFWRSMPRPLLVIFIAVAVTALGVIAAAIFGMGSFRIDVQDRRPPPEGDFSHGVGEVSPAPVPSEFPALRAPCDAVEGVRATGSAFFVARVTEALKSACSLAGAGVEPLLPEAVSGLRGAEIRVGDFDRTGVESSADRAASVIWVNIRLTDRRSPASHMVPVLLHEALHLARGGPPTAADELEARIAEVAACREVIPVAEWPRSCRDARALTELNQAEALRLLRNAGYR